MLKLKKNYSVNCFNQCLNLVKNLSKVILFTFICLISKKLHQLIGFYHNFIAERLIKGTNNFTKQYFLMLHA